MNLNPFSPHEPALRPRLLLLGVVCAVAVAGLALLVKSSPYLALDDSVERWLQGVDWGPLTNSFRFFSWLGGPGGGPYMEITAAVVVLLFNLRAWLYGAALLAGGLLYPLLVGWVDRPRPTVDQVVRITDHPGSTSFPSGHVIYISLSLGVVMLCVAHRYLPPWARVVGWLVVAAVALTAGLSRLYVGVHWPTDVLAGLLVAVGWMALVSSIGWLSGPAFHKKSRA